MARSGRASGRGHALESNKQRSHIMATRSITAAHSRNAVINTNELLHVILSFLPTSDLTNSRAVCTTWKKIITSSIALRRGLFLEPEPYDGPIWSFDAASGHLQPADQDPEDANQKTPGFFHTRPSQINTEFFTKVPGHENLPLGFRAKTCEYFLFRRSPSYAKIMSEPRWALNMHVTQPPVPAMLVQVALVPPKGSRTRLKRRVFRVEAKNEEGVTLGNLMEAMARDIGVGVLKRYKIDVSPRRDRRGTMAWPIGAIFVSNKERARIEGSEPFTRK